MAMYLDIHTVEAFIKVAELNSFTLTAEALCVTQSGITIKIQRLEKSLGYPLFHRTPRHIYLSPEGKAFLPKARELMQAHTSALTPANKEGGIRNFVIGISEHVVDAHILTTLSEMVDKYPELRIKTDINSSTKILHSIKNKTLDIAIITQDGDKKGGECVRRDKYNWYGKKSYFAAGEHLPLITMHDSCRLRTVAIELLTEHNINWFESFQGGGVNTIIAAAKSGLGIVPLPENSLSLLDKLELKDIGESLNLPKLPTAEVVIYNNCLDQLSRSLLKDLTASIRASAAQDCNHHRLPESYIEEHVRT